MRRREKTAELSSARQPEGHRHTTRVDGSPDLRTAETSLGAARKSACATSSDLAGSSAAKQPRRGRSQSGLTLVELIVAFTIMFLLTTMALPLARSKVRRERERELRYALREIRTAIDKYKDMAETGQLGMQKQGSENYPESLEVLVEGVKVTGQVDKKIRFLRRIPKDPFTNSTDWGKRSTNDDPKSNSWGGQNVFDVYTKTMEKAPDGTPYSEW